MVIDGQISGLSKLAYVLIVTQEEDCFSVQSGGNACVGGVQWSSTNIVVRREAIRVVELKKQIDGRQ